MSAGSGGRTHRYAHSFSSDFSSFGVSVAHDMSHSGAVGEESKAVIGSLTRAAR